MIAETEEELIKRLNEWKENVESKCMRVNMNKTKVMISGERQMVWQKAARWLCGVCNKGVGSNLKLRVQDQGEDQRRPGRGCT